MYLSPSKITLALGGLLLTAAQALASQAGWRQITIPGTAADAAPIVAVLYYPTAGAARSITMGPFTVNVAIQAAPEAKVKGLILLSQLLQQFMQHVVHLRCVNSRGCNFDRNASRSERLRFKSIF